MESARRVEESRDLFPSLHACGEGALRDNVTLQYRGGEVVLATVHHQLSFKLANLVSH